MAGSQLPPLDNLAVCQDHGIMTFASNERRECALCALDGDYEVRREAGIPGDSMGRSEVSQREVRQRLESEHLKELLPLMDEYLDDIGEGPMYLTVERYDGDMPAGYSESQERWINAVVYTFGRVEKAITTAGNAAETIDALQNEGYGSGGGE